MKMDATDSSETLQPIKLHGVTLKKNLIFRMNEITCHNWHCTSDRADENWYDRNDDAENKTTLKCM
jgi:hypothetical protein